MDDRELEARLRTRLHRRFDAAQASPVLVAEVRQAMTTPSRRLGLAGVRVRGMRLGWSALAAVVLVAVIALLGGRFGGLIGPGGPGDTPTGAIPSGPRQGPALERWFLVMPPTSALPSKADSSLAADVLSKRLGVFGFQSIVTAVGYAIQFRVPGDGPSDRGDTVRSVLSATGDVRVVPLPPADYGEGKLSARVGEPLPKDEPALFGWEGIASVAGDASTQRATLEITLRPEAADAFFVYTQSNVGERFAVVIDGRVALLPRINEPIVEGQIELAAGIEDERFTETVSILVGGKLPEAWANPVVPIILPLEEVEASVEREVSGATFVEANLEAIQDESTYGWREVWRITLDGDFGRVCLAPVLLPSGSVPDPCYSPTRLDVAVDASTGEVIWRDYSPP